MIWFDIQELERGLRNGEISDRVIFNYLLGNVILYSLSPYLVDNSSSIITLIILEAIIIIWITVIGCKKAFDINESGDNKDFFKRYLALSFVTGIRLLVFITIAAIPIGIIVAVLGLNKLGSENTKGLLDVILSIGIGVFYYYMLINSFKRVSHGEIA